MKSYFIKICSQDRWAWGLVSYFNLNFKNRTQKKLSLQNLELNFQKQKGDFKNLIRTYLNSRVIGVFIMIYYTYA